jgi:tetratricopeptide (TPR) repeat protein
MTYLFAGDFEKSYQQFQHSIAMDPTFPLAHQYFSFLLATMGRYEEAIQENEKAELLSGSSPEGARAEATTMLQALKSGGEKRFWQNNLEHNEPGNALTNRPAETFAVARSTWEQQPGLKR